METVNRSHKAEKVLERMKKKVNRQIAGSLLACVHCGNCTDSCHYVLANPGDPTYAPAYKADRIRKIFKRHMDWTGQVIPVVVVTDNGPAMKSAAVARWFKARPHFVHVRTRARSPHTNGVIERWFEALKYERLFRHDIATGIDLAAHVDDFMVEYNTVRPHEALGWARPLDAYLTDPGLKPNPPESEQDS